MDVASVLARDFGPIEQDYNHKDTILYALGIGLGAKPLDAECCGLDPARLKSMSLRFTRPVLLGDLLRFDFWDTGSGAIRFRASVPARDQLVLDRGMAAVEA